MKKNHQGPYTQPQRITYKTYSHLSAQKRMPSEYQRVSSNMLYYVEKGGFEVNTPISAWYEQHQRSSLLVPITLEQFVDPEATTYASYIQRQKIKEIALDAHFHHLDETTYDKELPIAWVKTLSALLAPLRYPWHGLQMVSSYIGSMAPESKVVMVLAFQTMDEMRRIQRIAYRMRQLQLSYPDFGIHSLAEWQQTPAWQPLRRCIEHLLVTYDWMEAFVALNVCIKPVLDQLLLIQLSKTAKQQGDSALGILFHSFWSDSCWHQDWSKHLLELLLKENVQHKPIIQRWLSLWGKELFSALAALKPLFLEEFDTQCNAVFHTYTTWLSQVDLEIKFPW